MSCERSHLKLVPLMTWPQLLRVYPFHLFLQLFQKSRVTRVEASQQGKKEVQQTGPETPLSFCYP